MELKIDRLALVSFGMKDRTYMHSIDHIPLSDDTTVYRQFDIGLEFTEEDIPFFAFDSDAYPELRGKVHLKLGGIRSLWTEGACNCKPRVSANSV